MEWWSSDTTSVDVTQSVRKAWGGRDTIDGSVQRDPSL